MRTFVRASLRTHARRYVAVALAVLIATAFMITTNALGAAAKDGWRGAIAAEFEGADAVLTDVRRGAVDRIADTEGVRAAATSDSGFFAISVGSVDATASVGTVANEEELRWQHLASGDFPAGPRQVLLSTDRADDAGVAAGDRLTVDVGARTMDFTIAGTVEPSAGDLGSSVYVSESAMARLMGDVPARVIVTLDGPPDAGRLGRLRDAAPGATVQTADAYVHDRQLEATGDIDVMQKMLFVFASIALIVAGLVIANTLAIVLAQRTRDVALLRCIGAKRRQITRSVLLETLVVAVVSAVAGVLGGLGLAYAGAALIGAAWPSIPVGTPSLSPLGIALPVGVSVGAALVAALVPARRTNRLSPLAALRPEVEPVGRSRPGIMRIVAAGVVLCAGFGAMASAAASGSLPVGMVGGGVSFAGVLLLGPVLVPGLIDGVRPVVGRIGGVPGRLAAANAVRNRRRTAATSAALLIGVTLISTVVVGTASMKGSVATEMDTRAPIDMVLDGERPLDGRTVDRVGAIDGVGDAASLDGTRVTLGSADSKTVAVGVDEAASAVVRPDGELRDVRADQVYVPFEVADRASLVDGDRVRVSGPDGSRRLEVRTGEDWGATAVVSAGTLATLDERPQPYAVWLRAADGADVGTVVGELNSLAGEVDGSIDGSLPQRKQVMTAMDVVLAVTVGLLGVAVIIAIVGVGNTLSLSVLERVRENALLRALGLRKGQQRAMLAVEALLIASVSTVLGIALGLAYAWFGIRTLAVEEFVTTPTVEIPAGQLVAVFVVAAVAGLLACVLPARRAAAIPPAAGLVAD
ncbi:ABC transporter permease [Solicola gregarius]|uniref:FtsX-like permease family protein n=1 Tax=Solicola gregarius TaxID=2908642 RepID=A0AA46YN02_9ACTN|nr:FtsX-like permease family protein [Solicola gregarius]UYM06986.1 FtsX-like permease family protein [Solicola gregarius]